MSQNQTNVQGGQQPSPSHLSPDQRREERRLLRDRFQWLNQFSDEELEQISLCEAGAPMVPGDDYFDISHPERGAFTGRTGEVVPEGSCLLRKGAMSPTIWNKLRNYGSRSNQG
jgi:hypothetical protein